jgi:hypothetical protein
MRIAFLSFVLSLLACATFMADAQEHATQFGTDSYAALGAYRGLVEEHALGIIRALRIIADTTEAKSSKEGEYRPLLTWHLFPSETASPPKLFEI